MVDDASVSRFVSLTGCPVDQARFYLEATGGQFDRAVAVYYEQNAASPHAPVSDGGMPSASVSWHAGQRPAAGAAERRPRGLLHLVAVLPFALIRTAVNIVVKALGVTIHVVGFVGQRVLPGRVLESVRGIASAITASSQEVDPTTAAELFVRRFREEYGERGPRFVECGWQEAAARAHRQYKFLLVYLHSPHHQDTDAYCRNALCNPDVADLINRLFVAWGGDIRYSDAFRLSASLRVSRYPYVALLAFSGANIQLVTFCEGFATAGQLLEVLHGAHEDHRGIMEAEMAAAQQRDWNRRLREEQDEEYQRSLEADRAREREREEQRKRQQEAARAAAAEEARRKAEQEERQRRKQQRAATLEQRRMTKRAGMPPEPAAGEPGTCQVRVRLPDGSTAQRRFAAGDSLQRVADFVESLDALQCLEYALANTYPRKEYTAADMGTDLDTLGLSPMAALFVHPKEDEEEEEQQPPMAA